MTAALDLDRYLERIGLRGRPGLAEVHRAHVSSIPFENLDPHRGVPVSLDIEALERKLVGARRGGYCFEQNLLLGAALTGLGLSVEPMLARVRLGRAPGVARPRTHLVLRVGHAGRSWLADVGFGGGTLLEPIPFAPDGEHEQSGWRYRLVTEGDEHVLQTADAAGWTDLYAFLPQPVPHVDLETSNWFTCTHPRSPFVTGLIVAAHRRDGTRIILSDWTELSLAEQAPGETTVAPVARPEIPGLLEERFGLGGFTLDAAGRVALASPA